MIHGPKSRPIGVHELLEFSGHICYQRWGDFYPILRFLFQLFGVAEGAFGGSRAVEVEVSDLLPYSTVGVLEAEPDILSELGDLLALCLMFKHASQDSASYPRSPRMMDHLHG